MARSEERLEPRELTAAEVRAVASSEGEGPRVSIFIPIDAGVPQMRQNPVRLRHALEEAAERLARGGWEESAARARLRALEGLVTDPGALPHPTRALAAYADGAGARAYALTPEREAEGVAVGESFALRPLLFALRRHLHFELLALSPKRVDLYRGDLRGLVPRRLEGVPRSLEEALGSDRERRQSQFSTGVGGGRARAQPIGVDRDERKHDLRRYHETVGHALVPVLRGVDAPLVLVADEVHGELSEELARLTGRELHPVYVSPDALGDHELHERAWSEVQELTAAREREAFDAFERARNHGKAALELSDVIRAAAAGRVRRLWLEEDRRLPGRVDPGLARVVEARGDEDALDELAALVLQRGGLVHLAAPADMPAPGETVAELR